MITKILTVRLPSGHYNDLYATAAEFGVSVSAHIRRVVECESEALQVNQLRIELFDKLIALSSASTTAPIEVTETPLLCRAIAAHCNPPMVSQVRASLAQAQAQA